MNIYTNSQMQCTKGLLVFNCSKGFLASSIESTLSWIKYK